MMKSYWWTNSKRPARGNDRAQSAGRYHPRRRIKLQRTDTEAAATGRLEAGRYSASREADKSEILNQAVRNFGLEERFLKL